MRLLIFHRSESGLRRWEIEERDLLLVLFGGMIFLADLGSRSMRALLAMTDSSDSRLCELRF